MDEYVVRYGGESYESIFRSNYMDKRQAKKFFDDIELNTSVTWKELLYEPLNEEDAQYIIKSESVKVIDLGMGKIAIPF